LLLPVERWTITLVGWVQGAGALGVLGYIAAYVAATALMLPGSALTIGGGFVYGIAGGMAVVLPASVLGASVAFGIGRFVARERVARLVAKHPRFRAIDAAVGEQGFKIVFLLRLSPIVPFNFLNYALSLTRVSFRDYFLASVFGMIPGGLLYVYLGSLVTDVAELAHGKRLAGPWGYALLGVGLVATIAATVIMGRVAGRSLARELAAAEARAPGPGPSG
jgi:uncharacterized membrane protein YdjX (TVP38/TMEM64 family)